MSFHKISLYCYSSQHISKQRVPGLSDELIKKGKHFILIRNPLEILVSCFYNRYSLLILHVEALNLISIEFFFTNIQRMY